MLRIIAAVLAGLLLSAPLSAGKPKPQPDGVTWQKVGTVSGVGTNSYTPVVILPTGIRVYMGNGTLNMASGTWASVGAFQTVLGCPVFDEASTTYCIRTNAVVRGASGLWYAVVNTGNGYPTTNGYRPALATSNDGISWAYQGHMVIDGDVPYVQTDAANLIVDESTPATIDNADPTNNRFRLFVNYYCFTDAIGQYCPTVAMVYGNGSEWHFWRGADGRVIDVIGPLYSGLAFPSAACDPFGCHLIGANTWPATKLHHFWSCDRGRTWRLLEDASDVINTTVGKGTNLVFDPSTNLLHALTSGVHWSIPAKAYSC